MALTTEEVEKVALLSRLQFTPQELASLTAELGKIVGYVDLLGEVDTTGVEPMAHAIELLNVTQDDQTRSSLTREEALANAPKQNGEGYLVPAVLGD